MLASSGYKGSTYGNDWKSQHILVCLSPEPNNSEVIRSAAAAASAYKGDFSAVYVESRREGDLTDEARRTLRENTRLASSLGASVETLQGEDVAFLISEFAKLCGATQIFLGHLTFSRFRRLPRYSVPVRLMNLLPTVDIHIIPYHVMHHRRTHTLKPILEGSSIRSIARDLLVIAVILAVFTALGFFFDMSHLNDSYVIPLYLLAILLTSVTTRNWYAPMAASVLSILLFNFFFAEPRFEFIASDQGMPITFLLMLTTAMVVSAITGRLQRHAKQSAQSSYQQKILFDTNRILQRVTDEEEIIMSTCMEISRLTNRNICYYFYDEEQDTLIGKMFFPKEAECRLSDKPSPRERNAAIESCRRRLITGSTTAYDHDARYLFVPVKTQAAIYGTVGVLMEGEILESLESSIIQAIAAEGALAIENTRRAKKMEEANLIAKNEELRMRLLRAISHDLRTPLTSIRGHSSNLLTSKDEFDSETLHQMYQDINDNAVWLVDLVENLLSASRLEEGRIKVSPQPEMLEEAVSEAINHLSTIRKGQTITVDHEDEFLMVMMDVRFIVQVIANILRNAVQYTPEGSHIHVSTGTRDGMGYVAIADNGNGVTEEIRSKIFDMFYTGETEIVDSRRSMGLGLFLCRSIIQSHGGEIFCDINQDGGCTFTFTLPLVDLSSLRLE